MILYYSDINYNPLQPVRGFVLKDTVGTADDADITCYYDGTPEYWESIF